MKKLVFLVMALLIAGTASAQTAMKRPPKSKNSFPTFKSKAETSSAMVKQAKKQEKGEFPEMVRSEFSGGQIQTAWNESNLRDGAKTFRKCENCVYKIRTREFMTTTIILPYYLNIKSVDLGDSSAFNVKIKDANVIAIRPTASGIDTNLNVYTNSKEVFSFYIRSESYKSKNVPDLVVRISSFLNNDFNEILNPEDEENDKIENVDIKDLSAPDREKDFVRNIKFDPSKLHGWDNYKLWGDRELRPKVVFRDSQFTYLQYEEKFDKLELPTAYVVIDKIDELVNTRVVDTTFIIESIENIISLKIGDKYLCIKYQGD